MFGISKKNLIILLAVLILLVIIFYWENVKEIVGPITEEVKKSEVKEGAPTETATPLEEKRPSEKEKLKITRKEFMDYVSKNISNLSPEKPVLGGKWYVTRFWFVKEAAAYVEYEDGHILRQILVEAKPKAEGEPEYKVVGYFVVPAGANEWMLKQGDDPYFGRLGELYEWDDIGKSWRKR